MQKKIPYYPLKGSFHFIRPKNELFLGIFHTTPIIDIHMILFGLDKSTLKGMLK